MITTTGAWILLAPVLPIAIWAAGSGVTGTYLCFTCTTGEADDSEDYEIE